VLLLDRMHAPLRIIFESGITFALVL